MKSRNILFVILATFLFACHNNENASSELYSPEGSSSFIPSNDDFSANEKTSIYSENETDNIKKTDNSEDKTISIEKKIIKTANISFGLSDYKKSKENITKIITEQKAYIASESENNTSYNISNTIIIRVPAESFEKLLSKLEGEAEDFESKSINTNDVTEEFVDITTRLKNKKKVEAQYNKLLKEARTIAEILEVNEHIRRLREEIEAKEGRLKYLKNQVGLSTITLYMHQDYDTISYGFFHKVSEALGGGWQGFLGFLIGLLYIWPLLIILGTIFYFVRTGIIKRRKRKSKK